MMKPSEKQIVSPVSPQFGAWKKVKLEEVAESIQTGPFGSQLHQSDYSIEGTPVIMPKDIIEGKVSTETIARVEELHVTRLARHKVKEGEIVYSRRGDVGKCAYITKKQEGWLCGTGCLKVTINKNEASPKFIFYQLQKKSVIGWIEKHAKGATMANLNTSILSDVPLELPSISIQDSIATTLSRYDKLIANYQRQIKLLEEAAQRLYKEWFVDLHFPGHENVKVIDGVPEGWEKKKIKEIGDVITGKTPKTSNPNYYGGKIPFITIPDMHKSVFPTSSTYLTTEGADSQKGKYIPANSILVSCIGTAGITCISKECCQTNQQINSIVLFDQEQVYYVYLCMSRLKEYLNNIGSNGATMTNVNKKKFEEIELLVPDTKVNGSFYTSCKTLFGQILNLSRQLTLLTESRDRLLPKLMSGEIELKI